VSDRFLAMMSALLLCMSARKAVRELSTEAGEGLVAETCFAGVWACREPTTKQATRR
jgi:hypothetical protein